MAGLIGSIRDERPAKFTFQNFPFGLHEASKCKSTQQQNASSALRMRSSLCVPTEQLTNLSNLFAVPTQSRQLLIRSLLTVKYVRILLGTQLL